MEDIIRSDGVNRKYTDSMRPAMHADHLTSVNPKSVAKYEQMVKTSHELKLIHERASETIERCRAREPTHQTLTLFDRYVEIGLLRQAGAQSAINDFIGLDTQKQLSQEKLKEWKEQFDVLVEHLELVEKATMEVLQDREIRCFVAWVRADEDAEAMEH